jgi:hypothetical protein
MYQAIFISERENAQENPISPLGLGEFMYLSFFELIIL